MTTKQHLQSLGLTGETVDALQAMRNAYSLYREAKRAPEAHRARREAKMRIEAAKRIAREESEHWH